TNDSKKEVGEKASGGGTNQERGEQMEHAAGKRRGRDIRLADTGVHATSQTDMPTQVLHLSLLKSVNVCRHLW
ncbi:hypothetical protein GQ42DRAFT_160036, partial [Ramicandelaber brevisporus]